MASGPGGPGGFGEQLEGEGGGWGRQDMRLGLVVAAAAYTPDVEGPVRWCAGECRTAGCPGGEGKKP